MEVRDYTYQSGRKNRFLKLFLPLLILGLGGFAVPFILSFSKADATPVTKVTTVTYSGTYTSGNGSTSATSDNALATPTCKPDTGFQNAGPISADNGQTGLFTQTDPVYSHAMYGYSAAQLADLSRQCSLMVTGDSEPYINAYTSYWIGWQFDYQTDDSGYCSVSNAKVMLHIHQALPTWANYGTASPALQKQWQNYESAVTAHESGHVKLIQQTANQLLLAMRNIEPADCSQVEKTVNQTGQDYLARLASANAGYDQQTRHGAIQGAIVP